MRLRKQTHKRNERKYKEKQTHRADELAEK